MLTIRQLEFEYPDAQLRYDFELPEGEVMAVVGARGSGKSTLFNLLAGFLTPTQGRMSWQGVAFDQSPPHQRPVSLLFQAHNLFEHRNVLDNLMLGGASEADAMSGLERLGLAELSRRYPTQLSGGQQQRVGLVRSLISQRPILLLDEPFAGLDPAAREDCLSALRILKEQGRTILFITHNAEDLQALSARALVIPQPLD